MARDVEQLVRDICRKTSLNKTFSIEMKFTLVIGLVFLIWRCDPAHEITSTIENNSSRQLILISQTFDADKLILGPGESKIVKHRGLGGYKYIKSQEFCPCADSIIKISTVDTTLKITKDIKNPDNWSKTSKRKNIKGGEFTCRFTLTDQDIK